MLKYRLINYIGTYLTTKTNTIKSKLGNKKNIKQTHNLFLHFYIKTSESKLKSGFHKN